jgi:FtsP/CotA-like multicopper oxidase with cupredoxin domain
MRVDKPCPPQTRHHSQQNSYLGRVWAGHRLWQATCCVALLGLLLTGLATPLMAQQRPALVQPVELCPKNGVLSISLGVEMQPAQVYDPLTKTFTALPVRTYNLGQNGIWEYCRGQGRIQNPMLPGPTLRLRKGTPGNADGSQLSLALTNRLPVSPVDEAHHACNPVINYSATVPARPDGTCDLADFPRLTTQWPACFHGDNVTNMHFHGLHISPQPPQDFVLLSLYPAGTPHITPSPTEQVGTYQYTLDPIPYTQAEGTHWYHPHRHGSTALQVTNGMAGAILIAGPFDDWLNGLYASVGGLSEQVLIVQQLAQGSNFFAQGTAPTLSKDCSSGACVCTAQSTSVTSPPTVNGQLNPIITMRPGEIQRWRFINAAVQAGGALTIGFPTDFHIKQIAQDGVQFAAQNYQQQPFLNLAWFVPNQPPQTLTTANLAPGNRADYLVQAPMVTELTCYSEVQSVFGNVAPAVRQRIDAAQRTLRAALRVQSTFTPLLTVCVDPNLGAKPMTLPSVAEWPVLPDFLKDISAQPPQPPLAFSMTYKATSADQPAPQEQPGPGNAMNQFYIDNVQYCPDCANRTMTLNVPEEWIITNDSAPQHPFHIHTNPHQLVEQGSIINGQYVPFRTYNPPVWGDTIALPAVTEASSQSQQGCWNVPAGPIVNNEAAPRLCSAACAAQTMTWYGNWVTTIPNEMSVCQCCPPNGSPGYVRIRQLPIDFTGEFVLHCHILGHEDRGMMQNAQVICPQGQYYGKARAGAAECVPGNFIPAVKPCPAEYKTGLTCASGS